MDIFINNDFNKFYKDNLSLKINTNTLQFLKNIKDKSINLIFVDPPYNIGKKFGNNKDKFNKDDYINFCILWINECMRILKDNGTIYNDCYTIYAIY